MRRARFGLTLLELLMSLLLLAMISTAVASVTGYSVRLFDRTEEIQQRSKELHHRTLLRGWIVRADPSTPAEFEGKAHDLRFRTRSDTALAWTHGWLTVQVTVQSGAELQLRNSDEILLETLRLSETELRFGYYGSQDGTLGWNDRWIGQDTLPLLIRISGADPDLWPDFIAMPHLSAD